MTAASASVVVSAMMGPMKDRLRVMTGGYFLSPGDLNALGTNRSTDGDGRPWLALIDLFGLPWSHAWLGLASRLTGIVLLEEQGFGEASSWWVGSWVGQSRAAGEYQNLFF